MKKNSINTRNVFVNVKIKVLVFSIALFVITYGLYADNGFKPESSVGFKSGVVISKAYFLPNVKQLYNYGMTSGLAFKFISEKYLGLQLEANYIQKGWTEELEIENSYSREMEYLQFAFLTHYMPGKGKTHFIFNIGPYASYLLSEKENINISNLVINNDYYGVKLDNNFELGGCLGVGFNRYTKIGIFQLESRFEYSFSNLFEEKHFIYSENLAMCLTLSYLFSF